MVSTDYVAKFQDSGRFTLRKIEATDQDAPGALKNEAQRGESGKDAEKWIYTVRIEISPKHPLGIGLSHLIHLLICNAEMICEPMITEGNKRKRQSQMTLPFSLVIFCADLLL
jgi:hypothetical protein